MKFVSLERDCAKIFPYPVPSFYNFLNKHFAFEFEKKKKKKNGKEVTVQENNKENSTYVKVHQLVEDDRNYNHFALYLVLLEK